MAELRKGPGNSMQDWAGQGVVGRLEEKEEVGAASQQGLSQGCQTTPAPGLWRSHVQAIGSGRANAV